MKKSLLSPAIAAPAQKPEAEDRNPFSQAPRANSRPGTRAGLKHIGAYLDDETVEKVAVLRARLKLDNSQLVKLAIEDLFATKRAESAFKR